MKFLVIAKSFGIFLTVAGWYLNLIDKNESFTKFLAPNYRKATQAFDELIYESGIIKDGDPGFTQISSLLSGYKSLKENASIKKIKRTELSPFITTDFFETKTLLTVEVITDRGTEYLCINDLRPELRKLYMNKNVFLYSAIIFSLGIICSIFCEFYPFKQKR